MYRGTMLSARELEAVRQIEDVVRLGRVRRIEAGRIVLERGETRTGPDVLHVDCTALGLNNAPATAIFQPGRIVLQQVQFLSPAFNAALVGFVEAHQRRRPPGQARHGQGRLQITADRYAWVRRHTGWLPPRITGARVTVSSAPLSFTRCQGTWDLSWGGRETCPVMVMGSARWWPRDLPGADDRASRTSQPQSRRKMR